MDRKDDMQESLPEKDRKRSGLSIGLIVLSTAVLTSVLTIWIAKAYLFPSAFKPTRLNDTEIQVLETKIKAITAPNGKAAGEKSGSDPKYVENKRQNPELKPEPYSETRAQREINLTERELNGLLARNADLARKMVIDLSDDLASARLLIDLPPDLPLVGGEILRVTAGMELRFAQGKPVVILKGVSLWGVPIPNAWLGGLKNVDLVSEFGIQRGFWQTFSAGVDDIRIREGSLSIRLKP